MLESVLKNIRSKLPIQNPLHSFVHNNILMMFEDDDFHTAVDKASKLYRARPYWPIHRYVELYSKGKITDPAIHAGIAHYLDGHPITVDLSLLGISPHDYYHRLMFSDFNFNDDDQQREISDKTLWNSCQEKMQEQGLILSRRDVRWRGRSFWEKYYKESFALSVHPLMIRLVSSYLDQGMSFWRNPFSSKGFWGFFVFDVLETEKFVTGWREDLVRLVKLHAEKKPEDLICELLTSMGIPSQQWEDFLLEILFDLKGWAGMVNKLETEPWQATIHAPEIKLVDYIAMVLIIEASVDNYHSKKESISLDIIRGREELIELNSFELSLALYQITTSFRLSERWFESLDQATLLKTINDIDSSEHRDKVRLWHESFEHHYHQEALEVIFGHIEAIGPEKTKSSPEAQVLFCIDDREESMRRHLEEYDPTIKSYGVVGFFGLDMKFQSIKNQRLIPQCPPVIKPQRIVKEFVLLNPQTFRKWNNFKGESSLSLYYQSRTLIRGFFATISLGLISTVPMFFQVFLPQFKKIVGKKFNNLFYQDPKTDLMIEKTSGGDSGYTKEEMASIVESILRMCGLDQDFSKLVILLSHGSTSSNNPFKQAYGCGACGGNAGIPNSRAFAKMVNDRSVRDLLVQKGIQIPDETFFVAGFHDTCTDEILFFNLGDLPVSYNSLFQKVKHALYEAGKRNAFERCQRFSSFTGKLTKDALRHAKERANDIAQPRPEYGHSSNALAIVGPRELTKGLFLNRRSFLLSYDWKLDPDGEVLKNVVIGGIPVAVNINMDYYFSAVDNDNFGCGSKLPLNPTSLLGVMTGSLGDLRIGLAKQMIEIHEPIRNLTIIEAPLERVRKLFDGHPRLKNILYHHWMRLVVKDPQTNTWWIFTEKDYMQLNLTGKRPSAFSSSLELLKSGQNLDFAEIKL
jgi:uncharacterized protein YbcC (UPF0753/DUF2309 family)